MTTLPKISCQNFENFLLELRKWWKKINFPKNLFLLKMFVWTCTKKFWQDCRNFVSRNTKEFPIVQITWSYNFLIRNCFHQKWFSNNGECNFDNPTITFSPKYQKTTDLPLRFQKRKREVMNFLEGKLFFLKLCFCTCRIHLWPSREKFVVKLWEHFARIPERMKNLCAFQTQ